MHRSLLPFILAIFGYAIVLLSATMPLFEWQLSEVVTDFPSTYEVHIPSSPGVTRIGDSLDDYFYVFSGELYVSKDGRKCSYDMDVVAKLSRTDAILEELSLSIKEFILWLYGWGWIEIILSVIYIWWFTIWYKRPLWEAVGFAIVFTSIVCVCSFGLTQILRILLPRVAPIGIEKTLDCYHGTVTFNVRLLKVQYGTLFVLFAGILLQLGAFGTMLRQIVKAVTERKESSKSTMN